MKQENVGRLFIIDCTGDVVIGDTILFKENGTFIVAKVLRENYGKLKQQHTFVMNVLLSFGLDPIPTGKRITRKGREIYKNWTRRKRWERESEREALQAAKHRRGAMARRERSKRIARQNSNMEGNIHARSDSKSR